MSATIGKQGQVLPFASIKESIVQHNCPLENYGCLHTVRPIQLFKNQLATPLASSDAKGEAISQPYRFEVELISERPDLD